MATNLSTGGTRTFACKQLSNLPPVVSDGQQSCKQPQCSHYCNGECCNPGRTSAFAPCPFDGKELPLVEAEAGNSKEAMLDASPLQRRNLL